MTIKDNNLLTQSFNQILSYLFGPFLIILGLMFMPSQAHALHDFDCGGHLESACDVGVQISHQRLSCDSGLTEVAGCGSNGAPACEGEASGWCTQITSCGSVGQRACCIFPFGDPDKAGCNEGLLEAVECTGNCYCEGGSGTESNGMCIVDPMCGGDGQRACTALERFAQPCDSGLYEDLTPEGSCETLLGSGNCESTAGGIGSIGTCTLPSKVGEICSLGQVIAIDSPPCEDGLLCKVASLEPFQARCFSDLEGQISKEICNTFLSRDLLDRAIADDDTLTFGYGEAGSAGVGVSFETGVAYGRDGCFSCYATECDVAELDASISTFVNTGNFDEVDVVCDTEVSPDCTGFDGLACSYSGSLDIVGDIGFTGSVYYVNCDADGDDVYDDIDLEYCLTLVEPENNCTRAGFTEALTFGVGINPSPIELGFAACTTIQTVAGCVDETGAYQEIVNEPPVCEVGGPYTEECTGLRTSVHVIGADSSDPDDDELTFAWSSSCPNPSFTSTTATSPVLTIDSITPSTSCNANLTVSDGEESASCSATVTVQDTTAPVITCPATSTLECSATVDTSIAANGSATASDSCDQSVTVVAQADTVVAGACGTLQSITRPWLATDDAGLTAQCNQAINVVDTTIPEISCPADIFQQSNVSQCSLDVNYTVTTSDTCDGTPVLSCVDQNGSAVAINGGNFPVGTTTVSCTSTDCSSNSNSCSFNVTVNDPPQIVSVTPATQMVQYSDKIDPVVVTATDCGPSEALTLEYEAADVPSWLSLSSTADSCARNVSSNLVECEFTLDNNDRVLGSVDDYVMDNIKAVDPVQLNGVTLKSSPAKTITVQVKHEDALLELHTDNDVAIQVATDGGNSGSFSLSLDIWERGPTNSPVDTILNTGQLAEPGDISRAVTMLTLQPIGPGGPVTGACTTTSVAPGTPTFSYANILTVVCDFDDVPVNTYEVIAKVIGDYYTGGPDEDVFTVFDPSLGFTTGGGWFYWPNTDEKTNYGFNMKYNKRRTNIRGSLLMIRHLADGTKYRVKSNAVEGLAVGNEADFSWASFNGKATYKDPSMVDPIGNHAFTTYVEDHDEPGRGVDKFWIEVFDKDDDMIEDSSIEHSPQDNAVIIEGGNIVVPHQTGAKRGRN